MNRRELLKLGSAALAAAARSSAYTPQSSGSVAQWEVFEISLLASKTGNPFLDTTLSATFTMGHRSVTVAGFYDGDANGAGAYKVRFMPDTPGEWSYVTSSNLAALAGRNGRFNCIAAKAGAHGPVSVRGEHHFAYADGAPYLPYGTTCYAWIHQTDAMQQQTLATLARAPFNKLRMCVFPKSYEYNHNEPELYPFERSAEGVSDFLRPNPAFFRHLEQRIARLGALGIQADLILFHPYDRWGYAAMPAQADELYLKYVLARLSSYHNVWWSLANEFDLMKAKTTQDFDRYFHIVEQHDPVGHLRSVHYSKVMYDYARPWVSHASLQTIDFDAAPAYFKAWRKPVCYDEIQYEGNLNRRWGNISGPEMVRRFWLGTMAGCYVTHGETFLDPKLKADESVTQPIWWSHGGALHGESVSRIAFLRKLVEESQVLVSGEHPSGLEASADPYYLNAVTTIKGAKQVQSILYYMDFHQPVWYEFPLPEGTFTAEAIDPWQMTITPIPGNFKGKTRLELSARPYQAVRFRRV